MNGEPCETIHWAARVHNGFYPGIPVEPLREIGGEEPSKMV